jgi:hypothetical protein
MGFQVLKVAVPEGVISCSELRSVEGTEASAVIIVLAGATPAVVQFTALIAFAPLMSPELLVRVQVSVGFTGELKIAIV